MRETESDTDEDDDLLKAAEELGMDLTGVRAEGSNGAADEKEEQVVAEGEAGTGGDGSNGSDEAEAEPAEAEAKEETKVED